MIFFKFGSHLKNGGHFGFFKTITLYDFIEKVFLFIHTEFGT